MRERRPGLGIMPLAKIAIIIMFLNYYCLALIRGFLIPKCTILCYMCMGISWIINQSNNGKSDYDIPNAFKWWIAFVVVSLCFLPFAYSKSDTIGAIIEYLQRLFLTYVIAYMAISEKSVRFPITLISIICICASVAILLNFTSLSGRISLSSGYVVSVNDIGSLMVYGLFTILYFLETVECSDWVKIITRAGLALMLIAVMFISGSRKAFIGAGILFVCLFLFGRSREKKLSVGTFLGIIFAGIVIVYLINIYLLDMMYDTSLYMRLFGRQAARAAESDESRFLLYRFAFNEFLENPLFGLGLGGFAAKYSGYTHSAFAEIIACSGLVGILYFVPFFSILVNQLRLIKCSKDIPEDNAWHRQLMAFYAAFMFIGVGIPYIYKDLPCIIFALFISSQCIGKERLYEGYKDE